MEHPIQQKHGNVTQNSEYDLQKITRQLFAGPLILLKLCDIVRRQQQLRLWRLLQDFEPRDGEEGVSKAQVFIKFKNGNNNSN